MLLNEHSPRELVENGSDVIDGFLQEAGSRVTMIVMLFG